MQSQAPLAEALFNDVKQNSSTLGKTCVECNLALLVVRFWSFEALQALVVQGVVNES